MPSSLGRGVSGGSGPVDAQEARHTQRGNGGDQGPQNENVDADQALATLAEGEVADAVGRKSGTQQVPGQGPAEEQDFASDLDRYFNSLLRFRDKIFLFFFSLATGAYRLTHFPDNTGRRQNKLQRVRKSRRLDSLELMLMELLVAGSGMRRSMMLNFACLMPTS